MRFLVMAVLILYLSTCLRGSGQFRRTADGGGNLVSLESLFKINDEIVIHFFIRRELHEVLLFSNLCHHRCFVANYNITSCKNNINSRITLRIFFWRIHIQYKTWRFPLEIWKLTLTLLIGEHPGNFWNNWTAFEQLFFFLFLCILHAQFLISNSKVFLEIFHRCHFFC